MSLVADRRRGARSLRGRRVAFLLSTDDAVRRADELRALLDSEPRLWQRDRQDREDILGGLSSDANRPIDLLAVEAGGTTDREISGAARAAGVTVVDFVELYTACTGRLPLTLLEPADVERRLQIAATTAARRRWWQRPFEAAVGALLLVLAAPLLLVVAVVVAVCDRRPVLFRQRRLGRGKRPFTLLKFRTMVHDAEAGGPRWAAPSDPRVTRLGRHLRRHHLDELPQLWNVVRGDLGLIGPRPIRRAFARRLTEQQPLYDARFLHPPGLTGWSQVLGPYGSTVDEHLVKLEMDLLYLERGSLLDDLYILAKTARATVTGGGL